MALTIENALNWQLGDLSATALQIEAQASTLDSLVLQFTNHSDIANAWHGSAGSNSANVANWIGRDLQALVEGFKNGASAIRGVLQTMEDAQMELRYAKATISTVDPTFSLNSQGTFTAPPFVPSGEVAVSEAAYQDSVTTATAVAAKAQSALQTLEAADLQLKNGIVSMFSNIKLNTAWVLQQNDALKYGQTDPLVSQALTLALQLLGPNYPGGIVNFRELPGRLGDLSTLIEGMTQDEVIEFMSGLNASELQKWNSVSADPTLTSFLSLNLDPVTAAALGQTPGPEEPNATVGDFTNLRYAMDIFSLFHKSGAAIDPFSDIAQGGSGDCYFLASLGAVALTDPSTLQKNIKQNANGSYTVTFYDNGQPVSITVLPDLPTTSGGGRAYAHDSGNTDWAAIYEKAYAEFKGNYLAISQGGNPADALSALLGSNVTTGWSGDADQLTPSSVAGRLAAHQYVTMSTVGNPKTPGVVEGHAYTVVSADPVKGTVTLMNPWGPNQGAPQFVTLTTAQLKTDFNFVEYATPNK